MKLKDVLAIRSKDDYIGVHTLHNDYMEKTYRIEWHYKELLNMEVTSIYAENNELHVFVEEK